MKIKFEVDVLLTQLYEVDVDLDHEVFDSVEEAAADWFAVHMHELEPVSQLLPGDVPKPLFAAAPSLNLSPVGKVPRCSCRWADCCHLRSRPNPRGLWV